MRRLLAAFLLVLALPLAAAAPDLPKLVQLIDYVGVDYLGAVRGGQVINEAEYAEMVDFTRAIQDQVRQLPSRPANAALQEQADRLAELVQQRQAAPLVATLAARLRHGLIAEFDVTVVPRRAPDLARAQQLFAENCAACHGAAGRGDGALARGMEPPPTDFTDAERYGQRTLYGLYSTITSGVADTPMSAFDQLSEEDRWGLAFLVGQWAVADAVRAADQAPFERGTPVGELGRLERFTIVTPDEARAEHGEAGAAAMAWLRTHPEVLFANDSPLAFARDKLNASVAAYAAGQRDEAYRLAVAAYLEGFELVEHRLDAVDGELRRTVEAEMTRYRNLVRDGRDLGEIEAQAERVRGLLDQVTERLDHGSLSSGAAFASAFIILLREGLEAILVVAALGAFLIKTDRRDALTYLHVGWAGALVLGGLTWLASVQLLDFSGENREITEGVAALVAMAVLFYVGFWMHSKTSALQWKRFIDGAVSKALSTGTLWGLAGLAFIAVYREVFETILFYQALWVQADVPAQSMLLSGLIAGALALAVLAWMILRYSTRLPLRQFFSATSLLMFVLAIVFAGKGVAALQEAGRLPLDPVDFPRIDLLGIYPNLQGLAVQATLLVLAMLVLWNTGSRRRRAAI